MGTEELDSPHAKAHLLLQVYTVGARFGRTATRGTALPAQQTLTQTYSHRCARVLSATPSCVKLAFIFIVFFHFFFWNFLFFVFLPQAHFDRCPLPISDYVTDTRSVLDQAVRVINAMLDIAAGFGLLETTLALLGLHQMVVQVRERALL